MCFWSFWLFFNLCVVLGNDLVTVSEKSCCDKERGSRKVPAQETHFRTLSLCARGGAGAERQGPGTAVPRAAPQGPGGACLRLAGARPSPRGAGWRPCPGLEGRASRGRQPPVIVCPLPVKPGNVRNIIQHFENSHQQDGPEPGTQRLSTGSFPEDPLEGDR